MHGLLIQSLHTFCVQKGVRKDRGFVDVTHGCPFPSGPDVQILSDEPVGHLVALPLDDSHTLRGQFVAAQLLEDVVARGAAVNPERSKKCVFKLKSLKLKFSNTGWSNWILHRTL